MNSRDLASDLIVRHGDRVVAGGVLVRVAGDYVVASDSAGIPIHDGPQELSASVVIVRNEPPTRTPWERLVGTERGMTDAGFVTIRIGVTYVDAALAVLLSDVPRDLVHVDALVRPA